MSIHIPSDMTLRVDTNPDGSLILHFRKRQLDPETTAIEATEIEDADVTADDAATTFTLKRHKTAVFDEKMALAKSLVALQCNDARTTALERMFVERCEEKQGDDLIETHRKFYFTISPQRDSVLSIAQALDSSFPTLKLGRLAGLKMLNDRKRAFQTKNMQDKQQAGRLSFAMDNRRTPRCTTPRGPPSSPNQPTRRRCSAEDLLRYCLQLRMNEGCPHTPRDDGHRLSMDDFVIQDRICAFKAGSKSHSNVLRVEYNKIICLFDDDTTKGLLRHIFQDGRKSIGNERKAELSRTQLENHGIMQYISEVDKYSRGKWRGIGASFLIKLFDDETAVCAEMGSVATAQASLDHVSSNTTAGYLAYRFEGDAPQKIGKITMNDGKRKVTMY